MSTPVDRRLLAALERLFEGLGSAFGIVIGVLIVLMAADIGLRYFRLGVLPWLIEVTEYLLAGGAFLAAPWVLRQGGHIRVDILLSSVSSAWSRRLEQLIDLIGGAASLVLTYYAAVAVAQAWRASVVVYKSWWTPEWLLLLPLPVACLLMALEFGLRLTRVTTAARPGAAERASI